MNVDVFSCKNILVFTNIFTNNNSLGLSHSHEDLLSYCIFWRGKELLIDSGRLSYSTKNLTGQSSHNGLFLQGRPLRPVQRWFSGKTDWHEAVNITIAGNQIDEKIYSAINKITGDQKTVNFKIFEHSIQINECYKTAKKNPIFSLANSFAATAFASVSDKRIFQTDKIVVKYSFDIKASSQERAKEFQSISPRILVKNCCNLVSESGVANTRINIKYEAEADN